MIAGKPAPSRTSARHTLRQGRRDVDAVSTGWSNIGWQATFAGPRTRPWRPSVPSTPLRVRKRTLAASTWRARACRSHSSSGPCPGAVDDRHVAEALADGVDPAGGPAVIIGGGMAPERNSAVRRVDREPAATSRGAPWRSSSSRHRKTFGSSSSVSSRLMPLLLRLLPTLYGRRLLGEAASGERRLAPELREARPTAKGCASRESGRLRGYRVVLGNASVSISDGAPVVTNRSRHWHDRIIVQGDRLTSGPAGSQAGVRFFAQGAPRAAHARRAVA